MVGLLFFIRLTDTRPPVCFLATTLAIFLASAGVSKGPRQDRSLTIRHLPAGGCLHSSTHHPAVSSVSLTTLTQPHSSMVLLRLVGLEDLLGSHEQQQQNLMLFFLSWSS